MPIPFASIGSSYLLYRERKRLREKRSIANVSCGVVRVGEGEVEANYS
jgi:hypothetical protein